MADLEGDSVEGDILGFEPMDHQREYLEALAGGLNLDRTCLYFRTGAGKSYAALAGIKQQGYDKALVITPPATYPQWLKLGQDMGVEVQVMSHAKFRRADTQVKRTVPIIADEFHMFGGRSAAGWTKLLAISYKLEAPMVLLSATPQYNDAERVYCVGRILEPARFRGGYLEFLYNHCHTKMNYFSATPEVVGFIKFRDAAHFLSSMDSVFYLPDERVVKTVDIDLKADIPPEMTDFMYDPRTGEMILSVIEYTHKARVYALITDEPDPGIRDYVWDAIAPVIGKRGKIMVFAQHSTVGKALESTLNAKGISNIYIHGKLPAKQKDFLLREFLGGGYRVLIGTASLATGTDGIDKLVDKLLILDDTDDEALRKQLIGRILPRGYDDDCSKKKIFRLNLV